MSHWSYLAILILGGGAALWYLSRRGAVGSSGGLAASWGSPVASRGGHDQQYTGASDNSFTGGGSDPSGTFS